jgi:hypothetical protein
MHAVPIEFVTQFEITADLDKLTDAGRTNMLIMKTDNYSDKSWLQNRLQGKERTWERVKEIFLTKFTSPSQSHQAVNEIKKLKQGKHETVKRFINRYNIKLALTERTIHSTDNRDKEDFENGLHQGVYEELFDLKKLKNVLGEKNVPLHRIQALAEEAEKNLLLRRHQHRKTAKQTKKKKDEDEDDDNDDDEENDDESESENEEKTEKKKKRKKKGKNKSEEAKEDDKKTDDKKNEKKEEGKGEKKKSSKKKTGTTVTFDEKPPQVLGEKEKTNTEVATRPMKYCANCNLYNHNTDECRVLNAMRIIGIASQQGASGQQGTNASNLPFQAGGSNAQAGQPNNHGTMREQRRYVANDQRGNPNDVQQID